MSTISVVILAVVIVAEEVIILPAASCETSRKSLRSPQWVTENVSSTTAPDECDCCVDPATPRVTPVIWLPDIPVKLTYSRRVGVALPLPSTRSITSTPGATRPVTVVRVMVVSGLVTLPLRVVEKAFVVLVSKRRAVIFPPK